MGKITITTTAAEDGIYWEKTVCEKIKTTNVLHVVNVHPEVEYQKFHGFGGAFTEASAHNYAGMSATKKREMIAAYYGEDGLRYNLGRINMNSCDFGLGNYTYITEGDASLDSFDISHDFKEIIPLIQDAQMQTTEEIEFLMSPWSPPAFMKTNGDMNHGGQLKKEYYQAWADYFVRFIQAYEAEGIQISYLTVQNEPMAVQTWDSCVYSSKEESLFVRDFLGPALVAANLSRVQIFVWDHNKEEAYNRFKEVVGDCETRKYVKGVAVHWYTGDHFEEIEMIRKMYPDKDVFFTEGCVEYSRFADSGEIDKAEMYGHDILGNLNGGISASMDWNLFLDEEGGPNHVGNFCAAPIMCNPSENTYEKRLTYYYIGHFSRFIRRDAVRIGTTRYTDKIEVTGFRNPDGERVIVLLNKTAEAIPVTLREDGEGIEFVAAPHAIYTICYHESQK